MGDNRIGTERSFNLVGEYMSKWAIAEYSADQVIASALNLTPMHSHLLSTTIPISNKLELTKTMISLSDMNQEEKNITRNKSDCLCIKPSIGIS